MCMSGYGWLLQGCHLFNLVQSETVKLLQILHGHNQGHPEQGYIEHFSKPLKETFYLSYKF